MMSCTVATLLVAAAVLTAVDAATVAPAVTAAPAATPAPTPAPLKIVYFCFGTKQFSFDVSRLVTSYEDYSFAIGDTATGLDRLKSTETPNTANQCFQIYTPIRGATTALKGNLSKCDVTKPMRLYLEITSLETQSISGGSKFEVHDLPCDISGAARVVTAKKIFNGLTLAPAYRTETPDIIKLELTSGGSSKKHTGFTVGEPLNLTITLVHSTGVHFLKVVSCDAAKDDAMTSGSGKIQLIDSTGVKQADIIPAANLTSTTAGGTTAISFTMYAFKFYDVDTVYIQCSVRVCQTPNKKECGITARKRRSADNELRTATTSFTVREKDEPVPAGQSRRVPNVLAIVTSIVLLRAAFM